MGFNRRLTPLRQTDCREFVWETAWFHRPALTAMLAADGFFGNVAAAENKEARRLAPRQPHFVSKAIGHFSIHVRRVSQVDTGTPKPELTRLSGS